MICVFGLIMACFACLWKGIGIELGWLFLVMGLLIGGAVFPAAFTVTWNGQTRLGAISGAIGGLCAGLIAWLVETQVYYGEFSVATTGASYPTLAGNMAGVLTGLILSLVISYIKPDNFDWEQTRAINAPQQGNAEAVVIQTNPELAAHHNEESQIVRDEEKEMLEDQIIIDEPARLQKTFVIAVVVSGVLSFTMDFIIPIPMFLSHYVFSKPFFTAWVVISFLWVFCALFLCGILPIWETRTFLKALFVQVAGVGKQKTPAETRSAITGELVSSEAGETTTDLGFQGKESLEKMK